MTNAWALAASILDGTLDEDYPIMNKEKTSEDFNVEVGSGNTDASPPHSPYYYDYDRNDSDRPDPFVDAFDHMMDEAVTNGTPYPQSYLADNDDQASHHFSLNSEVLEKEIMDNIREESERKRDSRYKYHESEIIRDIEEYVSGTYNGHYTGDTHEYRNVQTIDLMAARSLASAFCQSNILKYGSRYGSKDGRNKKDLLKVIHYAMLLLHFDEHYGKPSVTTGNIDHNMP